MAKTVSAALAALFATRAFNTAKLFTFTLFDGTVLNYCSGDQNMTWNGVTYSCGGPSQSGGPFFDRAANKAKTTFGLGANTTSMTFDVIPGSGTIEGIPLLFACRIGMFDGADFQYQRAYMSPSAPTSVVGALLMFGGRVGNVVWSQSLVTFACNSYLELLNTMWPRDVLLPQCINTLYDASCTLNPASFVVTGSSASGGTGYSFNGSGAVASELAGYFQLGKVTFSSGKNAGFSRGVQSHTVSGGVPTFNVFPPFPYAPAAGDTFDAYPGCDKQQATCIAKFNNRVNYRGMDYIPQAATAI